MEYTIVKSHLTRTLGIDLSCIIDIYIFNFSFLIDDVQQKLKLFFPPRSKCEYDNTKNIGNMRHKSGMDS